MAIRFIAKAWKRTDGRWFCGLLQGNTQGEGETKSAAISDCRDNMLLELIKMNENQKTEFVEIEL